MKNKKYKLVLLPLLTFLLVPLTSRAIDIVDLNPISHWTCDETSGIRYDSNTSNNNDLTDNNTVLYGTGLLNNACDFERGSNEYLSITNDDQDSLDVTTSFTVSAWVKYESTPPTDASYGIITKTDRSSGGYAFAYRTYPASNDNYSSELWNGGTVYYSTTADQNASTGTWYHLVQVFDVTLDVWRLYINGSLVSQTMSSTTISFTNSTAPFQIGKFSGQAEYFDGLIDEITIFPEALATTTIQTLYNSGTPLCYDCTEEETATTSTSTTSVDMSDTNFILITIVFFLMFIFLGLAFSPVNRKK